MSRFVQARGGVRAAPLFGLVLALAVPALASGWGKPPRLVDGSTSPRVPKALRAEQGVLRMTRVRVGTVATLRPSMPACPEARAAAGSLRAVERVGLTGRSVTFLTGRSTIAGCDRDPRARSIAGPWCGISGWRFAHGRVSDPRLALCYGRPRGLIAGFAWVNPVARARWIAVDQPGYREVYAVAGGLPVRVSTTSGLEPGRAVFRTSQYDARGALLVREEVVAEIAG